MTLRAVCDLAYREQVEQLERKALAQMTMAPHVEDPGQIPLPEDVVSEFQQWLISDAKGDDMTPEDADLTALLRSGG